jgi:hypothetical protein
MKDEFTELERVGKFALRIEPHWYAGHGYVANCWRYTVTVDHAYGWSHAASAHYSRADNAEAYAVTVDRGREAFRQQLARFGVDTAEVSQ